MIERWLLEEAFPGNNRLVSAFEEQSEMVASLEVARQSQAEATDSAAQATYITASANAELPNERVFQTGIGLTVADEDGFLKVSVTQEVAQVTSGFTVTFSSTAPAAIVVPPRGVMATTANIETLSNKTLDAPKLSGLGNYANDAAAATGGVPVGGMYRNGSVLMQRVA